MNMNNRKTILTLYKHKLRLCRQLGYVYGNWNDKYLDFHDNISFKKLKKYNARKLSNYMMNKIRIQYKLSISETDPYEINKTINIGFEMLKNMNYLIYKRTK